MKSQSITLDDLAAMVATGFDKTATKADLHVEVGRVTDRLDVIDKRLDHIERRLDHLEEVVLADHLQRIQAIEHAIGLRRVAA